MTLSAEYLQLEVPDSLPTAQNTIHNIYYI